MLAVPSTLATGTPQSLAQQVSAGQRPLVAFMSRSGNTRVVAGQIARAKAAALFEIQPAQPYPEDYQQTVDQAKRETDTGYEPPLRATVVELASHPVLYLGFPIWGTTAPPVIRSFLSRHDLAGKTLVPFITHGGYGTGSALSVIARLAPKAHLMDAFVMQADQERETLERVTQWLGRQGSRR
jgi:flavodoxin